MILTPAQETIAKDRHRFRVVCCGRRFGKTTLAIQEILGKALAKRSRIVYIAPTFQQARDIAWNELKHVLKDLIININESRLELTIRNIKDTESVIYLRGWESIETLRGQAFDFMVIDEIAMMRNWEYNWAEVLRPTLTDTKGEVMFISTPKGFNHFYDLYNKAQGDADYASFHFTSYDNLHLPQEEIEKAKQELTEEAFAQEYLADFRTNTGLTHKTWDRRKHVIPDFEVPHDWQRARGFDYGSTHPTSRVRFAIDYQNNEPTWFLERSYKVSSLEISGHAYAIKTQDYGYGFMPSYGDPSGAQWFKEFASHGLNIQPAVREGARNWVELGVEKINQLLKPRIGFMFHFPDGHVIKDAPSLFVLDTEENKEFVQEIERLQWKETRAGLTIPVLDEDNDPHGHFDLLAATRYLVVSHSGKMRSSERIMANIPRVQFDAYGNPAV